MKNIQKPELLMFVRTYLLMHLGKTVDEKMVSEFVADFKTLLNKYEPDASSASETKVINYTVGA